MLKDVVPGVITVCEGACLCEFMHVFDVCVASAAAGVSGEALG